MTKEEAKTKLIIMKAQAEMLLSIKGLKVSDVFDVAIDALSESKGEWIPVSKRLPDEEHKVYCQLSDGSNAVLYVQDNWGQMEWVDGMIGTGTYDVVAWREKPEPYKADRVEVEVSDDE